MRLIAFIILTLFTSLTNAQNIDSLLVKPQTLELSISTPQPRIGETFSLSIDANHIRANIFRSLYEKVKLSNDTQSDNSEIIMNVNALKTGKDEIGPLEFIINNTTYTTNKIFYEVIEALPNTDKGIWFRKIKTSDTTFCIIIEQRIPSSSKTIIENNNITLRSEPETDQIIKFKNYYSIDGLRGGNSRSSTNFNSIVDKDGADKQFMYGYSVYSFEIVDKNKKIVITKDKFENFPRDYEFKDIIVQ